MLLDDLVDLVREVRRTRTAAAWPLMRVRFKCFVPKIAPASGTISLVVYDCGFDVTLNQPGSKSALVSAPVSTVCRCSMEISEVDAHNQRVQVGLQVWQPLDDRRFLWLEVLIALAEASGSAEMHSVLSGRTGRR